MIRAGIFLAALICFFFLPIKIFAADNLLLNSGFEDGGGSSFSSWTKNVSTLSLSTGSGSDLVHSGNQSARFKSTSSSTKYLFQVVKITPGSSYKLSLWIRPISGNLQGFARISWYASTDGSGTELGSSDSPVVTTLNNWQQVGATAALPITANSLRAKVVLDPSTSESAEAVFDDATLSLVDPLAFTISLPSTMKIDQDFNIGVSLTGLTSSTKYFIKSLGGEPDNAASDLYRLLTWSDSKSTYLSWNGTWTDFPSFTSDSSGQANITIKSKFNSDTTLGNNKIVIRLRKDGTATNIDSDEAPVTVNSADAISSTSDDSGQKESATTTNPSANSSTTIVPTAIEDTLSDDQKESHTNNPFSFDSLIVSTGTKFLDSSTSGQSSNSGSVLSAVSQKQIKFPQSTPSSVAKTIPKTDFPITLALIGSGGSICFGAVMGFLTKNGILSKLRDIIAGDES